MKNLKIQKMMRIYYGARYWKMWTQTEKIKCDTAFKMNGLALLHSTQLNFKNTVRIIKKKSSKRHVLQFYSNNIMLRI